MKKLCALFLMGVVALLAYEWSAFPEAAVAAEKGYFRIVVLSDLHLPGNNLPAKEKAIQTLNSWADVDMVAVTGDTPAKGGTSEEYAFAKRFLGKLNKPLRVVGGNHDYIYPDHYPINEINRQHYKETSPEIRKMKLERFKETWGLRELFYSERVGNYLLVFLTPDDLVSNNYTQITDRQQAWLSEELSMNRDLPTIIFFHGPLKGTYASKKVLNSRSPDSHFAEPAENLKKILLQNPQVFLWVSGHLHIGATNSDFNSDINLYENQVRAIHNSDMNGSSVLSATDDKSSTHDTIWTNSLFLYPDKVIVKTYDHKQEIWLWNLERVIAPGKIPQRGSRIHDMPLAYAAILTNITWTNFYRRR